MRTDVSPVSCATRVRARACWQVRWRPHFLNNGWVPGMAINAPGPDRKPSCSLRAYRRVLDCHPMPSAELLGPTIGAVTAW